jgi:hypothetical protein
MSERLLADQPLRLERPSITLLAAFLAMAREFAAHGEPRYEAALRDPEAYLLRLARFAAGVNLPADRVPERASLSLASRTPISFGDSAPSRQSCCACSGHSRP